MRRLKASWLGIIAIMLAASTTYGQTFWQAGTGDWFTASNWTLGVPATPGDAVIANGGAAQIQAPGATVRRLRVGRVEGPGNLQVNGGTLNATDNLHLNETGIGLATMTVQGAGSITSPSTILGYTNGGTSNATITGSNSTLTSGALTVGLNGVANLNIENNGTAFVTNNLAINSASTVNLDGGTLRFNTIGGTGGLSRLAPFYTSGTIQLAGNRTFSQFVAGDQAIGFLFGVPAIIPSNKTLHIEGNATISDLDTVTAVTVNGGALISTGFTVTQGMLSIVNGGAVSTTGNAKVGLDLAGPSPKATVSGLGSSWTANNMNVGDASLGTLTIQDQALVYVNSALTVNSNGTVNLNGGTLRFDTASALNRIFFNSGTIQLAGNRNVGSDAAITQFCGATPTVVTDKNLTVEGTATLSKRLRIDGGIFKANALDFTIGGELDFYRGTLEVGSGSISGIQNLVVPANGDFRASGVQPVRISGANGSTITATGNVTLGDAAAVNGFYTNGTLAVGANAVTLADFNDVVFDSAALATLGSGGNPGTLNADNGLTLDFGGNITGHGTVSTPNNIAKPLINNGHITGNSVGEPITLPGYAKGVGTFDNVSFTGTFSPGLSPTSLTVGNVALSDTSTLVMELGGTSPGGGYDQILSSGALAFDGTLKVSLINGFTPSLGQTFNLFDWVSTGGMFDFLDLQPVAGLSWNTSDLYTTGELSLVATQEDADFDNNGEVDGRDFLIWQRNYNATGQTNNANGDANFDGTINGADLAVWEGQYGTPGPLVAAAAAVPEPASAVLILLALARLALRCRPLQRSQD